MARIIGYNDIPVLEINIPKFKIVPNNNIENRIRSVLTENGFYEVINHPFVNTLKDNCIKVDNPLDSNREFLRTNVLNSLIDNLLFNERRQKDSIKLFEISDIYSSKNQIHKEKRLAIIASGRVGLNYKDFSKKIDKKYLSNLLKDVFPNVAFDCEILSRSNIATKIKSEIVGLEISVDQLSLQPSENHSLTELPKDFIQYEPISEFPSSFKDLSYSIKDFDKSKELQDLILNFKHEVLKNVFIFDYFRNDKKDEIKIGFRFIFQSKDTTLSSSQIETVLDDIIMQSTKISGVVIPGLER